MQVKVRSTKTPSDIPLNVNTGEPVSTLKALYRQVANLSPAATIRLMYYGKELQDTMPLGSYNLADGAVVQAMIFG